MKILKTRWTFFNSCSTAVKYSVSEIINFYLLAAETFVYKTTFRTKQVIYFDESNRKYVPTLNHKSVFSRSDDVTRPHSLLCDLTLLSISIENVVLVVSQEKLLFTNVSITLFWAQSKKINFWGSDDVITMLQASRPKSWLGRGSFLLSDT